MGDTNSLLLLTYRDGEVDLDDPLRGVVGGLPSESVVRIRLAGISLAGASSLIAGSGFAADEVFAATDGNPFLTIEMASGADGMIPASVQDSVLARMRRLSSSGQNALKIMSVMPGRVSTQEAEALAGRASDGLVECEHRGLLVTEEGSVAFGHGLVRRAVEASLTSVERVAINHLVLGSLSSDTDPARLVHHAHASHDTSRLIELAPGAARAALTAGSFREAVDYFRLLTPHIDELSEEDKGPILDDWAWAEQLGGYDPVQRINEMSFEHYRETDDREGCARALANGALYYEWSGQRAKAEQSLHDATEALGPNPDGADLARMLEVGAYMAMMAGDAGAAIDLVDRALDAAGPDVDDALLVRCLVHKGIAANIVHYPDGQKPLQQAWQRAAAAGNWYEACRALINLADHAAENFDVVLATEHAERAIAVSEDHDQARTLWYSNATHARVLLLQGEWERAEELAREQLARTASGIVTLVALPVLGAIEARTGRKSALQTLNRAWEMAVDSAESQRLAPAASIVAEHAWITGDTEDVPLSEMGRVMGTALHHGLNWVSGSVAIWLWKLGELDEIPEGIAEPFRLVMGGEPMAAAGIWAERGCPYEQAMALAHGDAAARFEALDILDGLGATAVAAKLRQEMRDEGMSVPRRRPKQGDQIAGLTPRQTEVLALLTQRMSNVEIADQLFLSPRTVEHHVAAVMSKLNVSSRGEAVVKAAELGLLAAV
jgi:DNA-binding CsgD family transcriptional regulator/tetratricopeptide (TPR) repeat protein